jgi:hypothetical protein
MSLDASVEECYARWTACAKYMKAAKRKCKQKGIVAAQSNLGNVVCCSVQQTHSIEEFARLRLFCILSVAMLLSSKLSLAANAASLKHCHKCLLHGRPFFVGPRLVLISSSSDSDPIGRGERATCLIADRGKNNRYWSLRDPGLLGSIVEVLVVL